MKLHLVGGFLGSGKTTAITHAGKLMIADGASVSVITNDQGKYLVDSKFVQELNFPNAEVTDGCFCCNFDQLDKQIRWLQQRNNPSVIFAESVGSCTDLVATVLKPLLKLHSEPGRITFSTFVDSQLLLIYLREKKLPFNDDTTYIWEKQMEEAELLIVNKSDLLSDNEAELIRSEINKLCPSGTVMFQDSYKPESVGNWINALENLPAATGHKSIEVDYDKYASGEAGLAWLDEEIEFKSSRGSALIHARAFIELLLAQTHLEGYPVGHLKFLLSCGNQSQKISFTSVSSSECPEIDIGMDHNLVTLAVNARIQTTPAKLRKLVVRCIQQMRNESGATITEHCVSCFQPGYPRPTHRLE